MLLHVARFYSSLWLKIFCCTYILPLLTHPSTDACLDSYHILAVLNKVAMIWRRRQWHPTPVLLPGKSHGWRNLEGCSPWGHWGSDTTERLHFHFSLSCIGEGNGNPLQCPFLENPRDRGAWWAAVSGVAQSQTRLKWLSSSSHDMGVYIPFWVKCFYFRQINTQEWNCWIMW